MFAWFNRVGGWDVVLLLCLGRLVVFVAVGAGWAGLAVPSFLATFSDSHRLQRFLSGRVLFGSLGCGLGGCRDRLKTRAGGVEAPGGPLTSLTQPRSYHG